MRGYNKNNISLNPSLPPWGIPSFLIYTQRKGTPPSPLPPCGIPTSIFFVKEERDIGGEREIEG
jgi:hypothetical protein